MRKPAPACVRREAAWTRLDLWVVGNASSGYAPMWANVSPMHPPAAAASLAHAFLPCLEPQAWLGMVGAP